MKSCMMCGMPLEGNHEGDVGLETAEGPVCKFDVVNGVVKSPEEIFEGGVHFFMGSVADGNRALAERLTRKNMSMLPHWQANPFILLDGEQSSDEEFGVAMAKL
jgi:hypothetical protein